LPKVFGFFSLFSVSKFFPPTYLTSFCTHSIVKAWESLKWEGRIGSLKREGRNGNQNNALEIGARSERVEWELEGKLPPFFSFFLVIFLRGVVVTKKATATCCHCCLLLYV